VRPERNTASTGRTAVRLARQVDLTLASCDLSVSQFRVLTQLAQGNEAASALARKIAVTTSTASTVVDGLVQRGAVERRHSVEDRRLVYLALTEGGEDLLARANQAVQTRLESIVGELNDGALQAEAFGGLALWGEALNRSRRHWNDPYLDQVVMQ
jgi:long-chain acyl-CoA synthetase